MSSTPIPPRLNAIKSKSTVIEFKDSKIPEPSADILELFKNNTGARIDSANNWTVDVFPNMTPIMMYTMLTSIRHANTTEHREHAKCSVATICMYHMSIVYGFFLLNDLHVRSTPSAHARVWSESSWRNQFANFLIDLPIPDFLVTILSQFHSFETSRTKNVFFVPSAAGYDHDQFFGRVYPLNMFAAIHDCTANLPGNSSKVEVLRRLYSTPLYNILDPQFTCVIPDLIGVTIDSGTPTTANYVNSKLYQVFNSVINPVLFRDFQRRSSLAAISLKDPTFATAHVNAYDLMFAASAPNLRELKVVLQAVSAVLADAVPCRTTLGLFISSGSTDAILKHGYSTYPLPTWSHSTNATKTTIFRAIEDFTLVSEEQRAEDFHFLQRPAAAIPAPNRVTDVIYAATAAPAIAVQIPANHTITRYYPAALCHNAQIANGFPRHDNEDLVQFSNEVHTVPSVLVLDIDGDTTVTAYLPLIAGKIIESFELDGTTIEMPNAAKSLGMQNSMFADSAIPYKYVRPGSFYHPTVENVLPPLNRAQPNSTPRLPAASLLHNRLTVMLPHINRRIYENAVGNVLPGMTEVTPVNVLRYTQSMIGLRTVSGANNAPDQDAVPAMNEANLLVWSPYTYTPYESDDHPLPNLSDSRHYYLTNLRTIFGTDFNLVQAKHPYESLPVV